RRPVYCAAAYAFAAIVLPERKGMFARGNAQILPVEAMGAGLVAHPVSFAVPERAGVEGDDVKAGAREPLRENAAGSARSHDDVIDLGAFGEAPHRFGQPLHRPEPVRAIMWRLELAQ